MNRAFLEIGALLEPHWTGIPNVVAGIAEHALRDPTIDWRFIYDTIELPRTLVVRLLQQRSGAGGMDTLAELVWSEKPIPASLAQSGAGIFPNIKPTHRLFAREASIVHDLSPLLTPQFHNGENIFHFANRIHRDVETSDHLFCVSEATRQDVIHYFRKPAEQTSTIRLGIDIDPTHVAAAHLGSAGLTVEPYVAVIGTLEPRKNGRIVFDYLDRDPGFAHRQRIVFVGRDGWLEERSRLLARLDAAGVSADRIVFTGFVSEADKVALMLNSRFCIYPSFFEGFGLPILEAGALGKVTVCSNSSSMPEVMPEHCVFFDPRDVEAFGRALRVAERQADQSRSAARCRSEIVADIAAHGWLACYNSIATWIADQ